MSFSLFSLWAWVLFFKKSIIPSHQAASPSQSTKMACSAGTIPGSFVAKCAAAFDSSFVAFRFSANWERTQEIGSTLTCIKVTAWSFVWSIAALGAHTHLR